MRAEGYRVGGGRHPETAAVTKALVQAGLVARHTGEPLTEAMVLGVSGGLGAGYILWEFKAYAAPVIVLAFRNNWQYPKKFLEALAGRLGVEAEVLETGGEKRAERQLLETLEGGRPAVVWVDQAHLPYYFLPSREDGCWGHVVTVYGLDETAGEVLVDDYAARPFRLTLEELARSRGRIPSYKNRLLRLRAPAEVELESAVRAGIAHTVEHLGSKSTSFGLPAFRKWARLLTDGKNQKAWPRLFARGDGSYGGLYGTLRSAFQSIEAVSPYGGHLRDLYAEFLRQSAELLGAPGLEGVAERYEALAGRWHALAEAALPDEVEAFRETKELLRAKWGVFLEKGGEGLAEMRGQHERLESLAGELNRRLPLEEPRVEALFAELQEHLYGIYEAESEAIAALAAAI